MQRHNCDTSQGSNWLRGYKLVLKIGDALKAEGYFTNATVEAVNGLMATFVVASGTKRHPYNNRLRFPVGLDSALVVEFLSVVGEAYASGHYDASVDYARRLNASLLLCNCNDGDGDDDW